MRVALVAGAAAILVCAAAIPFAAAGGSPDDTQLPPSARPGPGGFAADLSVPGAGGRDWRLRVYRRRPSPPGSRIRLTRGLDYCLAVDQGARRGGGTLCELSAALALRLDARGLLTECGGPGWVLGEPIPAGPTCGLVDASVDSVTVGAEGVAPQTAALSPPFGLRINRSARILRRHGVDPSRVRRLPRVPQARAFLAFLNTPATPPGERTPRLTVTARRTNGDTIVRKVGGQVVPADFPTPPLPPPPGAPRARLQATGPDGIRWTSTAWRDSDGGLCATARRADDRRSFSLGCHGKLQVVDSLWHDGVNPYVTNSYRRPGEYAVFGFAHGDATGLTVTGPDGRVWDARLSRAWTTVHRGRRGDHIERFRLLPRSLKARAFLVVLPGRSPDQRPDLVFRTTLADGSTLIREP
jgi:hypothetical protein